MERHMSTIPHTYFRSARVLMLVYCIDDAESFDSLNSWLENAESAYMSSGQGSETLVVLVGNKLDLESEGERVVESKRAHSFAELHGIDKDLIFEVSAKENTNMDDMFNRIALKVHPQIVGAEKSRKEPPPPKPKKSGFCWVHVYYIVITIFLWVCLYVHVMQTLAMLIT